jgi:hypothetical protein
MSMSGAEKRQFFYKKGDLMNREEFTAELLRKSDNLQKLDDEAERLEKSWCGADLAFVGHESALSWFEKFLFCHPWWQRLSDRENVRRHFALKKTADDCYILLKRKTEERVGFAEQYGKFLNGWLADNDPEFNERKNILNGAILLRCDLLSLIRMLNGCLEDGWKNVPGMKVPSGCWAIIGEAGATIIGEINAYQNRLEAAVFFNGGAVSNWQFLVNEVQINLAKNATEEMIGEQTRRLKEAVEKIVEELDLQIGALEYGIECYCAIFAESAVKEKTIKETGER